MKKLCALFLTILIGILDCSSCLATDSTIPYTIDYPGNLMVVASDNTEVAAWESYGVPSEFVVDANTFDGTLPSDILAIAVNAAAIADLPIDFWVENGKRIYIYGQSVQVQDFIDAVGIEYLGRQIQIGNTEFIKKMDENQCFQVLAYENGFSGKWSLCAVLQPDPGNDSITVSHFYNVICGDFAKSITRIASDMIVDGDDNILVSRGLASISGVWELHRETAETISDKDLFALKGFLTPDVVGGGQVARFNKVTAKITTNSNDSIYNVAPQSNRDATTINVSLNFSLDGFQGATISGQKTYSSKTTVNMTKTKNSASWTYTNGANSLNNNEYIFGGCIMKTVNAGNPKQTFNATMTIGGSTTGWSSGGNVEPADFKVSYTYAT